MSTIKLYVKHNCPNSFEIIALLKSLNYKLDICIITDNFDPLLDGYARPVTLEDMQKDIPGAKIVPQALVDGVYIGDFLKIKEWVSIEK